jgi:signal peptidase II
LRPLRLAALSTRRLALGAAGAILLADQLTKWWAQRVLAAGPIDLGMVRLRLVENSGAAFGLLQGAGSLLALAAVAATVLIVLSIRTVARSSEALALGLILGGALGNLTDRLLRGPGLADGQVVDFVDLGWWPVFNVADSAISVGAVVLALGALRSH